VCIPKEAEKRSSTNTTYVGKVLVEKSGGRPKTKWWIPPADEARRDEQRKNGGDC